MGMSTHGFQCFPLAMPRPCSKPKLQRPLNPTLGVRSAKTRAQCSYTLKTAKRDLATPEGHSSQPPSGSRHGWPPLQPPSPSSPPPSWLWQWCHLPFTMLCCLSPSKSGVLYSHQLLCKPRPMLYTLRSVKGEGSLRQTQLSSKSPSLEFM